MPDSLLLFLAQLNPTVGAIQGNSQALLEAWHKANAAKADLVIATELFITGYPLEDLAAKPSLFPDVERTIHDLAVTTKEGAALLVGAPWRDDGKLYNAVLLLDKGRITAKVYKRSLPNYGPFDEKRTFTAGALPEPVAFRGHKLGILICEDMWTPDVAEHLHQQGADILIVPNGSPYETAKHRERLSLARDRVQATGLPLIYVNQLGGQDELVFDGASFAMNAKGDVQAQMAAWREDTLALQWNKASGGFETTVSAVASWPENEAATYHAAMLGLRDYVHKNGFKNVILGLSGGIDSALVAALAVDAFGADALHAVMMPSPYTSQESLDDATASARLLVCRLDTISIIPAMQAFESMLAPHFTGHTADITEENIQSRCRGLILMALSNKSGGMVMATGNKSEMAVGYATLYGDMCGGFAPLKDIYKTEVYRMAKWRNANKPIDAKGPDGIVIPENVLIKAPTAELRPDQKDQDSLPPYDVLDAILTCFIEYDMGIQETVAHGHDEATANRVWRMLCRAEYKRRQAPPGTKITRKHLTKDRRYPITRGGDK